MMDYFVANSSLAPAPSGIQSTAGAVPVKNDKGEVSMKKVKVHRYVSGKRPDYAPGESSEDSSEEDDFLDRRRPYDEVETAPDMVEIEEQLKIREQDDPRLRRLTRLQERRSEERDLSHRTQRHISEPEILVADINEHSIKERIRLDSESSEEEEVSDEEKERRREELKKRVLAKTQNTEEEILNEDDEDKSGSESESSSEYEEYTDSEEETGPRLKPVFVLKKDRITVMEKEKELYKQKQAEVEARKLAEEKKKQSFKLVEELVRKDSMVRGNKFESEGKINDVDTDDENGMEELDYEQWKLRELKRNKRDKEERELLEKERAEIERLRNMTEEERRQEARMNPKVITNKASKGKYKFLQKYYHRGVYYLDKDDSIFKRDFSGATLEDHFNKTVLPKVMQVKNFGRSGRTKYTHLVDQDTTQFDSPWISDTAQNLKFHANQAAGVKQIFERPSLKKKREE